MDLPQQVGIIDYTDPLFWMRFLTSVSYSVNFVMEKDI